MAHALDVTGVTPDAVRAVGLDTPGPASAEGVISARGATNFAAPEWWGFDIRDAVEARLQLPVIYNNDGNAAALYAHEHHFGADAAAPVVGRRRSSAPASAAASSRPAASSTARPAWPASSATCTSPWTGCSSTGSRCRGATAASTATSRASPR